MVLAVIWAFLMFMITTGQTFRMFRSQIYLSGFGQNCFDSPGERRPCKGLVVSFYTEGVGVMETGLTVSHSARLCVGEGEGPGGTREVL